ncbi:YlcI/YnfO family protein [Morganella sp. GD04133]|uniref:YlcI/YnfO family protein n=1 Tax=Morganella sp. GD04133 TaxID=2975435 RepID=UPI00244B5D1C|nr:YlcI/YnfO family protein [Morganella sp. GD04133]MDH0355732.1 hypothetical protein [Morganella sp. GD04133]
MATPNKNAKSQLTTVRIPHDVMDGMEDVKQPNESNAGFIVAAMRSEIVRRQASETGKDPLMSALDTLSRIEEIGIKANGEIKLLLSVVQDELQRKTKQSTE